MAEPWGSTCCCNTMMTSIHRLGGRVQERPMEGGRLDGIRPRPESSRTRASTEAQREQSPEAPSSSNSSPVPPSPSPSLLLAPPSRTLFSRTPCPSPRNRTLHSNHSSPSCTYTRSESSGNSPNSTPTSASPLGAQMPPCSPCCGSKEQSEEGW
jgi:hypothetical protein